MSLNPLGFVIPGAAIGLGALLIRPRRGFFPKGGIQIVAQVTIEEIHQDDLEITDHPVEQGASVSDHAFKRPKEVVIKCAWSNSRGDSGGLIGAAITAGVALANPSFGASVIAGVATGVAQSVLTGNSADQIKNVYSQLLALQESCTPFDILTGKRAYTSMLFKSLTVQTDVGTENSLVVTAHCKQVIITQVQVISVPLNTKALADPQSTLPVQNSGVKQAQDAVAATPDAGTMGGVSNQFKDVAKSIQEKFAQVTPTQMNDIPNAIQQANSVLTPALEAVQNVIDKTPLPADLPFSAVPQEIGVTLNGAIAPTATNGLLSAMQNMVPTLETANSILTDAIKAVGNTTLPTVLENIGAEFLLTQNRIAAILKQTSAAFERAPTPIVP